MGWLRFFPSVPFPLHETPPPPSIPMRFPVLFVALGLAASVVGVSLWPLYHFGALPFYPALVHARLMIEGFAAAFLTGLAFQKFAERPPRRIELLALGLPWIAAMAFHAAGHLAPGDGCFLLFLGVAAARVPGRPTWYLALGAGMAGLLLNLAFVTGKMPFQPEIYRLGSLLLNQGFPVLGLLAISDAWAKRPRPWLTVWLGLGILLALGWEARGGLREASLVKLGLVSAFAIRFRPELPAGTLSMAWRVGLFALALGLGLAAGMPAPNQAVSVTHFAFLAGFGLVLLSASARGRPGPVRWMRVVTGLVLIGAATRAPADFIPRITVTHHLYAAILWIAAVAVWTWGDRGKE